MTGKSEELTGVVSERLNSELQVGGKVRYFKQIIIQKKLQKEIKTDRDDNYDFYITSNPFNIVCE